MVKKQKDDKKMPADHFDPLLVESKQAETVVLMLDSPEEDVLIRACEAIYKFVEKSMDNKKILFGLSSVDRLLKLMQHDSRFVRRNSTMAMGSLSYHSEVRLYLRKMEDIFPVVNALLALDESTLVHEFALLILDNLSNEYSAKIKIYEEPSCFFNIVQLLDENDPDVQKNAIETLNKMLLDYEAKTFIREEVNGVVALSSVVNLIYSEYPIVQYLAFSTLERASQDELNRAVLREVEALDKLVNIIGNPEVKDIHVLSLKVLANCMEDKHNVRFMKETGGLAKLLAFIVDAKPDESEGGAKGDKAKKDKAKKPDKKGAKDKRGASPDKGVGGMPDGPIETEPIVKQNAALALARCAKNPDNRLILNESAAEKTLVLLLDRPEPGVQTAAATALAVMAERMASRLALGELEGIPPLVRLVTSDSPEVRQAAAFALSNASLKATNNCFEIIKCGGVDPLIKLMSDPWATTVASACTTLTNMANDEIIRKQVQQAGLIDQLQFALCNSDLEAQAAAALLVAAYVIDGESREQFVAAGNCEWLVALLKSPSVEVRRNACWAVTVCSVDPKTTLEICRLGGLEIVAEMNQSSSRKNRFTQCALERLLETNLSVKYAMKDRVETTSFIDDGFFDMGRTKFDGQFHRLDELPAEPEEPPAPPAEAMAADEDKKTSDKKKSNAGASGGAAGGSDRKRKGGTKKHGAKAKDKESSDDEAPEVTVVKTDETKVEEKVTTVPTDPLLHRYIETCRTAIAPLPTTWEQVVALAQYVSDRMGGSIDPAEIMNFNWELPLAELKFEINSNVIPIGFIKKGFFNHRALLFKVIADRIGISCNLVRGDFNRAWNEVLLCEDENDMYLIKVGGIPKTPPTRYITDLVYQPGHLLKADSLDAINYTKV